MTGLLTTLCEKFKIDPLPRPFTSRVGDGSGDDVGLKPVMNTHMTGLASTLLNATLMNASKRTYPEISFPVLEFTVVGICVSDYHGVLYSMILLKMT